MRSRDLHATHHGSGKCLRCYVRNRPKRQTIIFKPHKSWRDDSVIFFLAFTHIYTHQAILDGGSGNDDRSSAGFTYKALYSTHVLYNNMYTYYIIVMIYKVRVRSDVIAVRSLRAIRTHDGPKYEKIFVACENSIQTVEV